MSGSPIVAFDRLDFTVARRRWAFAVARRADIDAYFTARRARTPEIWNGNVLLLGAHRIEGRVLSGTFFATDYASFLAWLDWNCPGGEATNCFAMAALRGSDGGFLMGVMAAHTANPGRIYFPAGTPDAGDIMDGRVDFEAAVLRELTEETGVGATEIAITPGWQAVLAGPRLAIMKVMQASVPAAALRARILEFLARSRRAELADVRIVRDRRDFDPAMPPFVTAFLEHFWENGA
ncbi:MAG: NUDIX hydrolase [Proteobacteria bacterium]|nr:NUDIX hydrolase [Pseudomonadota bacterium]